MNHDEEKDVAAEGVSTGLTAKELEADARQLGAWLDHAPGATVNFAPSYITRLIIRLQAGARAMEDLAALKLAALGVRTVSPPDDPCWCGLAALKLTPSIASSPSMAEPKRHLEPCRAVRRAMGITR